MSQDDVTAVDSLTADSSRHYFVKPCAVSFSDAPEMSDPAFNDSSWAQLSPTLFFTDSVEKKFNGIAWFRIHVIIDSSLSEKEYAMAVSHMGASEIYLDGRLLTKFGKIGNKETSEYYDPQEKPFVFRLPAAGSHVIAIRYANFDAGKNKRIYRHNYAGMHIGVGIPHALITGTFARLWFFALAIMPLASIFLTLGFLHLCLFLFQRSIKSNYFFAVFMFFMAAIFSLPVFTIISSNPKLELFARLLLFPILFGLFISFLQSVRALFVRKRGIRFWIIIGIAAIALVLWIFDIDAFAYMFLGLLVAISFDTLYVIFQAIRQKQRGAWIIGITVLLVAGFLLTTVAIGLLQDSVDLNDSTTQGQILLLMIALAVLSIPVTMSVYLARNYAFMGRDLALRLKEVEILSEKNLQQEQEKKQLIENRKEELEKEVELRTTELQESQRQLVQQEKLASLGQLTAGIAHEIKNPLNFVTNFADLSGELLEELKTAQTDDDRASILAMLQQNLEKISEHGKRADSIVKSMLQHSRTGTGEKQPADMNKLCEEFLNLAFHGMRATVKDFNCAIEKKLDPTLPEIQVVTQDITRVLLNLLNNAFYAVRGKPDAKVSVETINKGKYVEIHVRDNGTGIPGSLVKRIFEPFFTTKPAGQGTGLGLSLSFDIIKAHNGNIEVKTASGEGTDFMITLPV
jgi:signal transduction histidine kinase